MPPKQQNDVHHPRYANQSAGPETKPITTLDGQPGHREMSQLNTEQTCSSEQRRHADGWLVGALLNSATAAQLVWFFGTLESREPDEPYRRIAAQLVREELELRS